MRQASRLRTPYSAAAEAGLVASAPDLAGIPVIEDLMPDPDRRDAALQWMLEDAYRAEAPGELTPAQARVLEALSRGAGEQGAADILGLELFTVKSAARDARRALGAKNTTHACCEALRRGLIP